MSLSENPRLSTMVDPKFIEFMRDIALKESQYVEVYKKFCAHIKMGLNKDQNINADTKCYITYIHRLPTGKETGKYLGADLGGSNFRVLLVNLEEGKEPEIDQKTFHVTNEVMTGSGENLFNFLAECFATFLAEHDAGDQTLPCGFTFSFPCVQVGVANALLVRWTKGYTAHGVEGEDVVRLLKEAITRRMGLNIDVVVVLNDTTGTLISAARINQNCRIGLIVGTGCNACYVENTKCIDTMDEDLRSQHKNMIVNIEWGAFGDGGCLEFISTKWDKIVDDNSPNMHQQIVEKMIAGFYLGELLRLVMIDAIKDELLFPKVPSRDDIIGLLDRTKDIFESEVVTSIDADDSSDFECVKGVMTTALNLPDMTEEDCRNIKYLCECLCKRAAHLIGTMLSALCNKINEPRTVVAVDGSVYRFHPKFDGYMRDIMRKFVNPKLEFDIQVAEDGSGQGAAILAAALTHDEERTSLTSNK